MTPAKAVTVFKYIGTAITVINDSRGRCRKFTLVECEERKAR